ncbi:MAG: SDR family oxidoreductase [Schleiferiaceae bacterium]|nr:SDR family oxidoreductase [Schleiferiaceae bacterium]
MSKNTIITGAGKGIGFAATKDFLAQGHRVLALSRNCEQLGALLQQHPEWTPQLHILPCDLTIASDLDKVRQFISDHAFAVDILINNAGALVNKPFETLTAEDFHYCYQVNVVAPAQMVQVVLPHLTESAHIINIGSIGGFQGSLKFAGLSAYSSAKAALVCLTECLQEEYKEKNWAFNSLCLGSVQTEMLEKAFPGYQASMTPEQLSAFLVGFALTGNSVFKGKILPVSISNP